MITSAWVSATAPPAYTDCVTPQNTTEKRAAEKIIQKASQKTLEKMSFSSKSDDLQSLYLDPYNKVK